MIIAMAIILGCFAMLAGMSHLRHQLYLRDIRRFDPANLPKAHHLFRLMVCHEYPLHFFYVILKAIIDTFSSPPIAERLLATGKFSQRALQRLGDTAFFFGVMVRAQAKDKQNRWHPEIQATLEELDRTHRATGALIEYHHEHFVATLGGVLQAYVDWFYVYGWRRPLPQEVAVVHAFLADLAKAMGLVRFPKSADELLAWNSDYESRWFSQAEENTIYAQWSEELLDAVLEALADLAPRLIARQTLEDILFTIGSKNFLKSYLAPRPPMDRQKKIYRLLRRLRLLGKLWAFFFPFRLRPFNFRGVALWMRKKAKEKNG
ncbi:hypothetical protein HY628_00435 [Candidatus Uhrbacteria bacterium]|nr:hypothetical protein [Candidatus Uhrbacteria bacterium]